MTNSMKRFLASKAGATAIEYGLIAALIAVVIKGALPKIGTQLSDNFRQISGNL